MDSQIKLNVLYNTYWWDLVIAGIIAFYFRNHQCLIAKLVKLPVI